MKTVSVGICFGDTITKQHLGYAVVDIEVREEDLESLKPTPWAIAAREKAASKTKAIFRWGPHPVTSAAIRKTIDLGINPGDDNAQLCIQVLPPELEIRDFWKNRLMTQDESAEFFAELHEQERQADLPQENRAELKKDADLSSRQGGAEIIQFLPAP